MRSGRASDKREMTHDDHIGKEVSEAGGIQEAIDTLQNSLDSESVEVVDFADGAGQDILNLGEDGVQSFQGIPDSAKVG